MRRAAWALLAALAACGGKNHAKAPVGVNPEPSSAVAPALPAPKRAASDAPPPSHLVATVAEKSIGPVVTRRGDVVMAAYIGVEESVGRRVVSVPLGVDGAERGDAQVVAPLATDATSLIVRPTGGAGAGFVAAWTALTDRGEALVVVGVEDAGKPRGTPVEVARTADDIVWADVVPTPRGAVCAWAEETRGGDANVLAVALDPDGKMRGVPARVARGVSGWQIAQTAQGAALALVMTTGDAQKKGAARAGTLSWLRLDADARPAGAPVVIAPKPTVSGDVDVARMEGRFLFAWTDRTGVDPDVTLASLGDDGAVVPPRKVLASAGGSALVGLVAGRAGALVAWDAPNRRGRPTRRVHLAHVDPLGELDGRTTSVDVAGRGAPELAATDAGFALLGEARACAKGEACGGAPSVPTFVRFDANLTPTQTEPMRLGDDRDPAQLAWGLSCAGERCLTLSASGDPARVRAVDLEPRANGFAAPVAPPIPPDAPRVGVVTTLGQGQPFADVAVAKVGDGSLVALLTSALDEGEQGGREKGGGATITLRQLDAKGQPVGAASTLTTRALTVGGVAIAPGKTPDDGAAVAWVARDGASEASPGGGPRLSAGDPQVHVTRVDKRGKRQNDVQLTTAKGDASDVAIAWGGDGWLVAWVDARSGNGEVYATKVALDLSRVAREERITDAPGDASDVTILAPSGARTDAWLAWADPRESPQDGYADIFVAPIKAHDAKRAGEEVRVLASAAHSRSPSLAGTADGVVVGWIEEAPAGADAASTSAYGAMIARLDDRGRPRGPIVKTLGAGDGFPTAIALDAAGALVRGVVARASKELLDVDALELAPRAGAARAFPLLTLDGPPSLDVSLVLTGGANALFWSDDGPEPGDRRARRAAILWRD